MRGRLIPVGQFLEHDATLHTHRPRWFSRLPAVSGLWTALWGRTDALSLDVREVGPISGLGWSLITSRE
jgi:hypothetical protein